MHTLLGALEAGPGAFLAVRIVVLPAFCGAFPAKVRTNAAELLGLPAAEAHQLRGAIARRGALHVQLDAPCHFFHVLLLQTGGRAVIAQRRAAQARVNTFLIIMIIHKKTFKVNNP